MFLHFLGNDTWIVLAIIWAIIPVLNFFIFSRVPIPPVMPEHKRLSIRQLLSSRVFIFMLLFIMCAGAVEQTVVQWVSLFAEKGLNINKAFGDLLGPCLFGVLMGISRVAFAKYGKKLNLRRAMIVFSGGCILCYAGIVLIQIPILSLICCAACGFFVANLWPGLLSLNAEYHPNGGAAAFGIMSIAGALGCSVGPWLVGVISDYAILASESLARLSETLAVSTELIGLKIGILASVAFAVFLFAGLIALRKFKPRVSRR